MVGVGNRRKQMLQIQLTRGDRSYGKNAVRVALPHGTDLARYPLTHRSFASQFALRPAAINGNADLRPNYVDIFLRREAPAAARQ